jgi:hypothetical protein
MTMSSNNMNILTLVKIKDKAEKRIKRIINSI